MLVSAHPAFSVSELQIFQGDHCGRKQRRPFSDQSTQEVRQNKGVKRTPPSGDWQPRKMFEACNRVLALSVVQEKCKHYPMLIGVLEQNLKERLLPV